MKTIVLDSTKVKEIVQEFISRKYGIYTSYIRADHGYVDSDVFFRDIDLSTGKYVTRHEPVISYGNCEKKLDASFTDILRDHLAIRGQELVGSPDYIVKVPSSQMEDVRRLRENFCGHVDTSLIVTVTVKDPTKRVHIRSIL